MKRTTIGPGAYLGSDNKYYARPVINHRRTWRVLEATTPRKAILEANQTTWAPRANNFETLTEMWLAAGCPCKHGHRANQKQPRKAAEWLIKYFKAHRLDEIRMARCHEYAQWRRKHIKRGNKANPHRGGRTIDIELVFLSNIIHFAVKLDLLDYNPIRSGRDRYQRQTRHARVVMPQTAEAIHQIAAEFLQTVRSEVFAWHAFYAEFTGCRTSEILRLRFDTQSKNDPGHIEWLTPGEIKDRGTDIVGHLYLGRRSKNGLNPWAKIGPEFAEMIRAHQNWYRTRFGTKIISRGPYAPSRVPFGALAESSDSTLDPRPSTAFYFPSRLPSERITDYAFGHALTRITRQLGLPHITPHGFRAFYATKRLRDGARTVDIAAEMGDKTVSLVETIYADNPDGRKLWWTPADGLPAWQKWLPKENEKISVNNTISPKNSPSAID